MTNIIGFLMSLAAGLVTLWWITTPPALVRNRVAPPVITVRIFADLGPLLKALGRAAASTAALGTAFTEVTRAAMAFEEELAVQEALNAADLPD